MTNLIALINGKAQNKAINLLANTAGMIATGLAVATAAAVFTPAAEAKVQNCWTLPRDGQTHQPFNCDVNQRRLADDTVVHDIRHFEGKGAYFTVRLWKNNNGRPAGADLWINGEQYQVEHYTDKHGDTRLVFDEYGKFIF